MNFLEVCFGRIPYGNVHTKATSKKSTPPSGNFRLKPEASGAFPVARLAGWKMILSL